MPQTKGKKKVFSKFRPFIHSGEIKDNSDFVCSLYSDSSAAFSSINSLLKPKFSKFARTFLKSADVSFVSSDFATFLEMKNLPLR